MIEESVLREYGANSKDLGVFTLISIPLAILAILGSAWYAGSCGRYKLRLVLSNLVSLLTLVVVLALLTFKMPSVFGLALLVVQVCMAGSMSINFEMLA